MYEIVDLSFDINGKNILDRLSLTFPNKKFIGLIGPNGSGKSTLLKCLYRQIQPTQGQVIYKNKSVDKWGNKRICQGNRCYGSGKPYTFRFFS